MRRAYWLFVLATAIACSKIPSREKSRTPQEEEPEVPFTPDPDPSDGAYLQQLDGFETYEASCPDALPEAGSACFEYQGAYDCPFPDDGSVTHCTCQVIPEGDWWSCRRDE